jgi:hypothetical protein
MDKKTVKIIRQAEELGIVNHTKVRNIKICERFDELKKIEKMKYAARIEKLSKEYFLSEYQIERIISNGKKRKNN